MPANLNQAALRALYCATVALAACTGEKAAERSALEQYAPPNDAAIEAVSLSATDDDTFHPDRVGTAFPDTTRQVAVWYRWTEADPSQAVAIRWYKGDAVVLEQGEPFGKPAGSAAWVLKMGADGVLPEGSYRVELLENEKPVSTIPFQVGSEQTAVGRPQEPEQPEDASTRVATPDTAAASPGAPVETVPPEDTAPATPPATEPPAGAVIAGGQETKWSGIMAEVSELRRKGSAVSAKVRFSNRGSGPAEPDFYYKETYLLDADNKKYEVLKDDAGRYLAALRTGYSDRWYDVIAPGASQTVWMRFSAPPAGVKVVTLQIPGVEPFEDLPITE